MGTQSSVISSDFIDHTEASNLSFRYNNGASGALYLLEIVGGGVALIDCDNDNDLDLFFPQGALLDNTLTPVQAQPRLFRNLLNSNKQLMFTDITEDSGIQSGDYGVGVAAGDINRDGWIDLYLTSFDNNRLLINQGDCKFRESKELNDTRWGVSAAFLDYDRDGWLDLFLGNYVDHQLETQTPCIDSGGSIDYCGPKSYQPQKNRLWRNNTDETFTDVTNTAGIGQEYGGALGIVAADLDGDGWQDIYVANDQRPNLLWRNLGNGHFENTALLAGCAVNSAGLAEASMGVDLGDVDGDGQLDLFMSHLRQESNTLYLMKNGRCTDRSTRSALAATSMSFTGFGTGYLDYDNDGDLDIFVANGEVEIVAEQAAQGDPMPLRQRNQLFENTGSGNFREITPEEQPILSHEAVSRGVGFGDLDNDGDTDLIVVNSGEKAQLLLNQVGQKQNWHGLIVRYEPNGPYAIGSQVTAILNNGKRLLRRVARDGSYASANDPRIRFGLGQEQRVKQFKITWPNGQVSVHDAIEINQYQTVVQNEANN